MLPCRDTAQIPATPCPTFVRLLAAAVLCSAVGAASPLSAPAYCLEGRAIGGPCGICGKWIPAGGSCSCWNRRGGRDDGIQQPPPPPLQPPPKQPTPEELARQQAQAVAQSLNETGVAHYNAGRWQEAIDAFSAALAKWPDNATMQQNLRNAQAALAGERLRQASDRVTAEMGQVFVEGQLGDIEELDRQVREMERTQSAEWTGQFAEQARAMDDFRTARENALQGMGVPAAGGGRPGELPWQAGISNPQIARVMRGLRDIQVPPPIPASEVSMSWKSLTEKHGPGVLEKTGEFGFLAWDLLAKPGGGTPLHCKVLLIAGKTFIAGEDGAYVHLVKQDGIYEQALGFLRDPATTRQFAELVRDLRETGEAPESADPAMLRAARALNDPKLGSSGARIAWDAMLSPEARAAMVRKACLEVGSELMGTGTQGLLTDLTKQRSIYDALSIRRRHAQQMLKHAGDPVEREQLKKVIAHANHLTGQMYRLERAGPILGSYAIGKAVEPLLPNAEGKERQP